MIQLLLVIIYISFVSLGLPDSLLGSAWPIECAYFLRWYCYNDYIRRNYRIKPHVGQVNKKAWNRFTNGNQCANNSRSLVWFFLGKFIYTALLMGNSLRAWCRCSRRSLKQLCCTVFFIQAYELAALLLGSRSCLKPLYHGLLPYQWSRLE